jgi:hypothetical protein
LRINISAAMSRSGRFSQTALVAVEHVRVARPTPTSRATWQHIVRYIGQTGPTVEAARYQIIRMVREAAEIRPWVVVDTGAGGGAALFNVILEARNAGDFPKDGPAGPIPRPSAYRERGNARQELIDVILTAYAGDTLRFQAGLPLRGELARALANRNSTVAEDGIIATGSDEALVTALGLAMRWGPYHGTFPAYQQRDGQRIIAQSFSVEPY